MWGPFAKFCFSKACYAPNWATRALTSECGSSTSLRNILIPSVESCSSKMGHAGGSTAAALTSIKSSANSLRNILRPSMKFCCSKVGHASDWAAAAQAADLSGFAGEPRGTNRFCLALWGDRSGCSAVVDPPPRPATTGFGALQLPGKGRKENMERSSWTNDSCNREANVPVACCFTHSYWGTHVSACRESG